ncbi:MAG: UPF0182 family protein, partial [Candidatus Eisenbacteria bacterium]|nr:UPF0182 family protein [Candidatus Eisenbacteria bacterium]
LIGTAAAYFLLGGLLVGRRLAAAPRVHLACLGLLIAVLYAWKYWLSRFTLLYSPRGATYGASYTDLHAQLPAYHILIIVALGVAVVLGFSAWRRNTRYLAAGVVVFLAAAFVGTVVFPALVQKFSVEPNELQKELPYIEKTIRYTRQAYDLDRIDPRPFPVEEQLSWSDLEENPATVNNVRLWDWRPLRSTYRQLQEIRPYYSFHDVDVDRYHIDGEYRQVMLSPRELAYDQIPQRARTWVNLHLKYTHGYGLCLSPVNRVTPEGLPDFLIRDIPPRSEGGLDITQPAIYFGELTSAYSLVRTTTEEFDYPVGDTNKFTTYGADAGVPIGDLAARLLLAWHLKSSKILLTGYFQEESRILLYRRLQERIPKLAPYLIYDADPYIVIHEGRLVWIQDAYTISSRFPYSEPYRARLNYIRNAVKVVVDAYTGRTTFYVFDDEDPLIRTYQSIFPDLYRPAAEMPEGLRRHVRYPEDLFSVQARVFATYHMTDPQVFYNREDLWEIPRETQAGNEVLVQPYYVIMRLPESDQVEMIIMMPFSPNNKDNMIAWLAARCDAPHYGEQMVFLFPKQKLIYGPRQIEARIDQDPDISELLTLWSQRGSRVLRGNLLVIPIEKSLLYVEPLYIQAEKGELPELKRVIIASGNRISMAPTLMDALENAFLGEEAPAERPPAEPREPGVPPVLEDTAAESWRIFREGQDALRAGDWEAYGEAQRKLEDLLQRMAEEVQ